MRRIGLVFVLAFGCLLVAPSQPSAAPPVAPVEVVNEPLEVTGSVDVSQPVEVTGSVEVTNPTCTPARWQFVGFTSTAIDGAAGGPLRGDWRRRCGWIYTRPAVFSSTMAAMKA